MVTIGVDPHKRTHSAVAVDEVGAELMKRDRLLGMAHSIRVFDVVLLAAGDS
jgi:hypothetical protein